MPQTFVVGSKADLNAALAEIDLGGPSSAPSTAYTVTLSSQLSAINLAAKSTLAIKGAGHLPLDLAKGEPLESVS